MVNTEKQKEQVYLARVYEELLRKEQEVTTLLAVAKESGYEDMRRMSEDIRLNFDSVSDNLETFSAIEAKNKEIDQMNWRIDQAVLVLSKVQRLLKSPYFGKITVDFLEEEPLENFYIGINNFATNDGESLIYDWRSPIAELFYANTLGRASYQTESRTIEAVINHRRQFVIERDQLINLFDTSVTIQDDVLLEVLAQDTSNQMTDITATIQKEQNQIIRDTVHPVVLVNGVAGSGKTSTILQRIAYLLYSLRQEITSENILILSPNHGFIEYISKILPTLGEQNPQNMTLLQLLQKYLPVEIEQEEALFTRISQEEVTPETAVLRSAEYVSAIDQLDGQGVKPSIFLREVSWRGKSFFSKQMIEKIYASTPDNAGIRERVQATRAVLLRRWEETIRKQARSKKIMDQLLSLSEEQQQKAFGHLMTDESETMLYPYAERFLKKRYRQVTKRIQTFDWIDVHSLFLTCFESYAGYPYPKEEHPMTVDEAVSYLLIHHQLVEKIDTADIRFLLVDEAQDYTPAQWLLLSALFPTSRMTIVGDENQAIFTTFSPFSTIEEVFADRGVQRYDLLNSYRSTGAITKLFRRFSTNEQQMTILPIRPEGKQPTVFSYETSQDLEKVIRQLLLEYQKETLTLLTKTEKEAEKFSDDFQKLLKKSVIEIFPISRAKGLEFPHVLLVGVGKGQEMSPREKRLLYTAISRGMQTVAIAYTTAQGLPEEFLY